MEGKGEAVTQRNGGMEEEERRGVEDRDRDGWMLSEVVNWIIVRSYEYERFSSGRKEDPAHDE